MKVPAFSLAQARIEVFWIYIYIFFLSLFYEVYSQYTSLLTADCILLIKECSAEKPAGKKCSEAT